MSKKGFTLVELLAVIAILAILVIIALPNVLKMYRQSRINNFQNEVRSVYKTAQSKFVSDSMNLATGETVLYTNIENCTPSGVDSVKALDMSGNSNFKYYVLINSAGKILNVRASNGTHSYAIKAIGTSRPIKIENIDVEANNQATLESDMRNTLCPSEAEIYSPVIADCVTEGCTKTAVGTELIIGGENFYVVSSETNGDTVLLAKYDLKQDGNSYVQDTSGTNTDIVKVNFLDSSNTAYWDESQYVWDGSNFIRTNSTSGLISPYSDGGKIYCKNENETNCAYVYDSNAVNMYSVVNAYANKIGATVDTTATGKLLSLEEAYALKSSGTAGANAIKDKNNYYYRLGSAFSTYSMWHGNPYGGLNHNDASVTRSVRPAITVSTAAL